MISAFILSLMLSASQCTTFETDLLDAQNLNIGTVTITNTTEQLIIDIDVPFPWFFGTYHIYAGNGPLPTNAAGNVAPQLFPFSEGFSYKHHTYTVVIDEIDLGVDLSNPSNLLVAVHCVAHRVSGGNVVQSETTWGFGNPFNGTQWGWSIDYLPCSTGFGSRSDLGLDIDQIKIGSTSTLTATGAASGELVHFVYNNGLLNPNAGYSNVAMGTTRLDLAGSNVSVLGSALADSNGVAELALAIPALHSAYASSIVAMQAVIIRGTSGLSAIKSNVRLMRLEN